MDSRERDADVVPVCGCGPTPEEAARFAALRASAPGQGRKLPLPLLDDVAQDTSSRHEALSFRRLRAVRRPSRRHVLGAGLLGAAGLLVLGSGPLPPAAFAASYPSWDDVQRARSNESAKAAEISNIQTLIAQLQANVESTRAEAELRANEFFVAQEEYFAAVDRAEELQQQADAQAALAVEASEKAARVAAQIYRNGGDDTALELFFAGSAAGADDLLARLGSMDKLLERNRDVYSAAVTARDSAQSLSDQAVVARDERDRLQAVAEQKMQEAQAAADAAQAALDAQSEHLVVLEAQLAALQDSTAKTVTAYQEGVEVARREREAAEQRAREEAARLAQQSGGGSGGSIVTSGWARPSSGRFTAGYGARATICVNGSCTTGHRGVDLATGCGAGIFAANSGTVTYAGWNGQHGYYVLVDHGSGVQTSYSHIQSGGILVRSGQSVGSGSLIAREGDTGLAQGCHLHFEVHVNGSRIDPSPFMSARGVSL